MTILCVIVFHTGAVYYKHTVSLPIDPIHISAQITKETDAVLIGTIKKNVKRYPHHSKLFLQVHALRTERNQSLHPSSGLVQISVPFIWPENIFPGDTITIRSTLQPVPSVSSPAEGFNKAAYYKQQDIYVTGKTSTFFHISKLEQPESFFNKMHYLPEKLRHTITFFIEKYTRKDIAGVYKAILTGDRSGISHNISELFKQAGIAHILAISGMHLSILSLFLFFLFYNFFKQFEYLMLRINIKKLSYLFVIPILFFYSLLAGSGIPVIRAVVMITVVGLALCYNKPKSGFPLFSAALLLLLLVDPRAIFSASMQLSFTAVISIYLITPTLSDLVGTTLPCSIVKRISGWIIATFLVSATATLATLPVLLFHFNRFSFAGPLYNLLAEPLICLWSLIFGFIAVAFLPFSKIIAAIFLLGGSIGIEICLYMLSISKNFLGICSCWKPAPSMFAIILYYFFFFFLLQRKLFFKKTKLVILILFVFIFSSFFIDYGKSINFRPESNAAQISVHTIQSGHIIVLRFPDSTTAVLAKKLSSSKRKSHKTGSYLLRKKIKKIDFLILDDPKNTEHPEIAFFLNQLNVRKTMCYSQLPCKKQLPTIDVHTSDQSLPIAKNAEIHFDRKNSIHSIYYKSIQLQTDGEQLIVSSRKINKKQNRNNTTNNSDTPILIVSNTKIKPSKHGQNTFLYKQKSVPCIFTENAQLVEIKTNGETVEITHPVNTNITPR